MRGRYSFFSDLGIFLMRLAVGAYFTAAGLRKVLGILDSSDPSAFLKSAGYQAMTPPWLPGWFSTPYGYALPWVELLAGIGLIMGLLTRFNAAVVFLMLLSFQIARGDAAYRAVGSINYEWWYKAYCEGKPAFDTNWVMITIPLAVLFLGPGRMSIDRLIFGKPKDALLGE